ncbi:3-carboxy-cis,cis-muconate cycloisomerase [Roseovarius sp.]|uniref:3-carboxy-cis,cis-muconate cycloisomerase n=1 Tax=Roseovarius sp. TaxID=1486281 RepID=UPI0026049654|nr:3-carboxy-cis,cis-muconate cycloisomerase [Roseovarius sp.]MDM8165242.1 3-carboxy-cis,cis-muconate cycloisomerase [Roseovarius sp.]
MTGAEPGGWLEAVAGDPPTSARLAEARRLQDMLRVEAAYSRALGAVGQVTPEIADAAASAIETAQIDTARLAQEAAEDGMPVPSLSRQLRAALPGELHGALHKGLTSQDVMDTALVLALRDILDDFETRLDRVDAALADLDARFGNAPLMARTRMQAALPVAVSDRIALWRRPLAGHRDRLAELRPRLLRLQLGGPVGTRGTFHGHGDVIAGHMAKALDLGNPETAWHTDRAPLAELGGWLSMVAGSLGKMGHDIALMTQQGVDAAKLKGGGSSSAMAHKVNPVSAELLVTLARYTAVQLPGLHLALDHEQERSGISWTLEWLILPPMLVATGAALSRAEVLARAIESMGDSRTEEGPSDP